MKKNTRIVLAQSNIRWEDRDYNINQAEGIITACSNADYVLFPEMSFTGFSMNTVASCDDGSTFERVQEIAKRNHTGVGFGWVRKNNSEPQKCENVYSIIGPNGNCISEYVKIHPFTFSGENKHFVSGNKISVYSIDGIPFTTFICYDLRFPEIFRTIAEKVHAVIIPANWPEKRAEHWKVLLRARAIENQIYIFAINCQGNIGGQYYSGDSCIITPNGEVLNMLSNKEGIITYDLVDNVEQIRNSFPVLRDCRSGISIEQKL